MPSLEERVEEVQLIRASTSEREFKWRGSDEEKRIWESLLDPEAEPSKIVSSPFAFALRLTEEDKRPDLWLNVDYRQETSGSVQLGVHGPDVKRDDLDRIKKCVEERHKEAIREGKR